MNSTASNDAPIGGQIYNVTIAGSGLTGEASGTGVLPPHPTAHNIYSSIHNFIIVLPVSHTTTHVVAQEGLGIFWDPSDVS